MSCDRMDQLAASVTSPPAPFQTVQGFEHLRANAGLSPAMPAVRPSAIRKIKPSYLNDRIACGRRFPNTYAGHAPSPCAKVVSRAKSRGWSEQEGADSSLRESKPPKPCKGSDGKHSTAAPAYPVRKSRFSDFNLMLSGGAVGGQACS
jgi:hypothetical protein